jgi:hypothetical protein
MQPFTATAHMPSAEQVATAFARSQGEHPESWQPTLGSDSETQLLLHAFIPDGQTPLSNRSTSVPSEHVVKTSTVSTSAVTVLKLITGARRWRCPEAASRRRVPHATLAAVADRGEAGDENG